MTRKTLAAWTEDLLPTMGVVQYLNASRADDGLVHVTARNNAGLQVEVALSQDGFRAFLLEALGAISPGFGRSRLLPQVHSG